MSTTAPDGPENPNSPSLGDQLRKMAATYSGRLSPTAADLEALAARADRLEDQADVGRRWAAQASLLEYERDEARAQVERARAALDRMDRDGYIEEGDDGVLRGHTLRQFTRSLRAALDSEAGR